MALHPAMVAFQTREGRLCTKLRTPPRSPKQTRVLAHAPGLKEAIRHTLPVGIAVAVGMAVFSTGSPANALSYAERIAALEKRKELLAETRAQAESGMPDGTASTADSSKTYLDKIKDQLSIKIEDNDEAIKDTPSSEETSRFKPFNFISAPEPASAPLKDGKRVADVKPPAPMQAQQPSAQAGTPALVKDPESVEAQPEEKSSRPWWERLEELAGPELSKPLSSQQASQASPAAQSAPAPVLTPKVAPAPAAPSKVTAAPGVAAKAPVNVNASAPASVAAKGEAGRKRQANGFKLFGAQMLLLGTYVGLGFVVLTKPEELAEMKVRINRKLLQIGKGSQ